MSAPSHDMEHHGEKAPDVSEVPSSDRTSNESSPPSSGVVGRLRRFNARIEGLSGFEARGIARVPPEKRQPPSLMDDLQVALLWFSANISLNNLAVATFGPLLFGLGFLDSAMCAVFGTIIGAASTAYMSTWGPQSGNRTMVVCRFFMGYYPSKIPCFLNIVLMTGYCTIDAILGGQVLSAVNGGDLTIAVGIVIVSLVCWVVTVFGMAIFHKYERFAWVPQILVLFAFIGCAGPYFDTTAPSVVTGKALAASRLSFFSLCLYVPNSWGAAASDFYVYYPERTSKVKIFALTQVGITLAFCLVYMIAIGIATGIANQPSWAAANNVSTGALIDAGFAPLGGFGKFCSVIIAFGVISNSVPGTYSAALDCQVMGRWGNILPRWVWSSLLVLLQLVLALAGRAHLSAIFTNFLALMGYWLMIMDCIILEEHVIFRWRKTIDWERYEDKSYLPIGIAALTSFLLGWVGAILGMSQVWYVGPLASLSNGADVGMWVGCGFALITFPPLRYLELKKIGR